MKDFIQPIRMRYAPHQTSRGYFRGGGFTLLEVLLALGIFAIGFVFIAAIFPVAALLQKRAFDDVQAQQVARNTEALLRGRGISALALASPTYGLPQPGSHSVNYDTDMRVHPLPPQMLTASTSPMIWTLSDRSYPSLIADETARKFYWVPLVVDLNNTVTNYDWRVYAFVLQKRNGAVYPMTTLVLPEVWANPNDDTTNNKVPRVRSVQVFKGNAIDQFMFNVSTFNSDNDGNGLPDQIAVGDEILDNNGTIYTVFEAGADYILVDGMINPVPNPVTEIWYAPPGEDGLGNPSGKPSPTVRILILPDNTSGNSIIQ